MIEVADLSEREELIDKIRELPWILSHESMAAAFELGEPRVWNCIDER